MARLTSIHPILTQELDLEQLLQLLIRIRYLPPHLISLQPHLPDLVNYLRERILD
jgi:hypothetical protein